MNRAAILIPAHNRRGLTLGCLATLRANHDLGEHDVYVVDDGSTDGTGDAVRAEFPGVITLPGNGTLYWTGAIRLAMREAVARGLQTPVFWLNDDCRPHTGALRTMREFLQSNPDAVAGPRCVDATSKEMVPTGFVGRKQLGAAPDELRRVEGLSGFCVGIGVTAWKRLAPPDAERFPHYAGDTAYTLLAHRAGCQVVLVGGATIELLDHVGGPAPLTARIRPGQTLAQNWRRIFAASNSPYRLRTLLALQRLKYGAVRGSGLAATRGAMWIAEFCAIRALRSLRVCKYPGAP